MSNEKSALEAMLEQYEKNNAPKYEKKSEKVYDLKNYFNTHIKDGVKSATKEIRILPSKNGYEYMYMGRHKVTVRHQINDDLSKMIGRTLRTCLLLASNFSITVLFFIIGECTELFYKLQYPI